MRNTKARVFRVAAIIIITLLLISASSLALAFADTQGHWAEEAIERWSSEYRIFIGFEGLFRPNADLTRAEMAVLLDRILGYQADSDYQFDDVSDAEWYAQAVSRLHTAGVILGDGRNANPKRTVTREQAVTMLARAFDVNTVHGSAGTLRYRDSAEISDWAAPSVGAMTALGFVQGRDGLFDPQANLTRAEAVTILDNMLSKLYTEGGVYEQDVAGNALINAEETVILRDMTIQGNLYIACNVTEPVVLMDAVIEGSIVNYSGVEPVRFDLIGDEGEEKEELEELLGEFINYEGYQIPVLEDVEKCPYDLSLFAKTPDGRMTYEAQGYTLRTGIDVSAWQNEIDWRQVAAQDIDFAMLRAGYRGYTGGTVNEDVCFRQNLKGALDAGLDVGVYFFSQAITEEEAVEEARFLLELIGDAPITYPLVFDWEPIADPKARTNGLDTETLSRAAKAFCGVIRDAGHTPMIYLNLYTAYLRYDLREIDDFDFWLAQYGDTPSFYYGFTMWQYRANGSVAGIEGGVDMNLSFVDYAARGTADSAGN